MTPTPPTEMTGRVSASSPLSTVKPGMSAADFGDLSDVSAGFLDGGDVGQLGETQQGIGLDVDAGAAGDVVEHDGLIDGFGDGLEVLVLALLGGLVVVGRGGEDGVDALDFGGFGGFADGLGGGVGGCTGDDGDASGGDLDGDLDDLAPFVVREGGSFSGGSAGNQEVDSGFDLPGYERAQRFVIDRSISQGTESQSPFRIHVI